MFENQGEYICANPVESYFTKSDRAHASVYKFHLRSDGFEPYAIMYALLRSPKSFFTVNPLFSNSTAKISPIDFLTGSSLLMNIVIVIGSLFICHLLLIFSAPFSFSALLIISFANPGLYLKLNDSSCSITVRYSGTDGP